MTDYLSHLVARVLRTQPVLEPVVPSLFEPLGLGEVEIETEATRGAPERPALAVAPIALAESTTFHEHAEAPAGATPRPHVPSRIETHDIVHEPRATATAPTHVVEAVIQQQSIELHERSITEQHSRELRALSIEPHVPPAAARVVQRPTVSVPLARARRDSPVPSAVGPVQSRRAEGRQQTIHTVVEPEVQITIGRVDVRAVMPPPPVDASRATEPARASPAMPLEDYLRQKDGGRR